MYNVQRLRWARDMTQEALAERAGVSRYTIARLEGQQQVGISLDVASRLAQALGVTIEDLLQDF